MEVSNGYFHSNYVQRQLGKPLEGVQGQLGKPPQGLDGVGDVGGFKSGYTEYGDNVS